MTFSWQICYNQSKLRDMQCPLAITLQNQTISTKKLFFKMGPHEPVKSLEMGNRMACGS